MSLKKFLYPKGSIERKIIEIKDDIEKIVKQYTDEPFWLYDFGAYKIDPKHYAFWICLKTDKTKKDLQNNKTLNKGLRFLLEKHDYPTREEDKVFIVFECQETVNRESNGDWIEHFH